MVLHLSGAQDPVRSPASDRDDEGGAFATWPFINAIPPTAEEVSFYLSLLETHVDDPVTGMCRVCCAHRCASWRNALTWLIDVDCEPDRPMP